MMCGGWLSCGHLPGAANDDRLALRAEELLAAVAGRRLDGLADGPLHALEDRGRGGGLCGRLIDGGGGGAVAVYGRQRYITAFGLWHASYIIYLSNILYTLLSVSAMQAGPNRRALLEFKYLACLGSDRKVTRN